MRYSMKYGYIIDQDCWQSVFTECWNIFAQPHRLVTYEDYVSYLAIL